MSRPLPDWFDDAKFGIFVHWTAAAVPAYAPVGATPAEVDSAEAISSALVANPYVEWYQNSVAIPGSPAARHHAEHYGDAPYDDFVATFRAGHDAWDPEAWADLFQRAGARYVVLVTKHHDGFCLWPTAHPNPHKANWAAERDLVGELAAAVRARGMRFGTYYSGGLDWTFGGLPITDLMSMIAAIPQSDEYIAYADAHLRELIDRYEPSVLWGDIGYPAGADLEGMFADYFAAVPDGVVNNRFDYVAQTRGDRHCDFVTPEYRTTTSVDRKFEVCRGIGTSFGYNRAAGEDDYLPADRFITMLADIVANGGNLLLNVGPTGAGEIPETQARRLLELGWWLARNGEAIYDTRPWSTPAVTREDGTEVRYTCSADGTVVYAIVLDPPPTARVALPGVTFAPGGGTVHRLGVPTALPCSVEDATLVVTLPEPPPVTAAIVFAVRGGAPCG